MIRCTHCQKRFVVDHKQLTFYSQQELSKWNDIISLLIERKSTKNIAIETGIDESTCFRMRRKILDNVIGSNK